MCVSAHVDRHVINPDRHVGAVVEVVAAQEILIGFSLARVLGHDQPGSGFRNFRQDASPGARSVPRRWLGSGLPFAARSPVPSRRSRHLTAAWPPGPLPSPRALSGRQQACCPRIVLALELAAALAQPASAIGVALAAPRKLYRELMRPNWARSPLPPRTERWTRPARQAPIDPTASSPPPLTSTERTSQIPGIAGWRLGIASVGRLSNGKSLESHEYDVNMKSSYSGTSGRLRNATSDNHDRRRPPRRGG
jgi:hypothetical protein